MKKLLLISACVLLGGLSLQAQEEQQEECDGQEEIEIGAGGVVYYPVAEHRWGGFRELDSYTIKGIVTDGEGLVLLGATVKAGLENGVMGDVNGEFSIEIENDSMPAILEFRYLGYYPLRAVVGPEYNEQRFRVVMKEVNKPRVEKGFYTRKPAIYLYPESKSNVVVKHHFKGEILNTYPAYGDGWEVIAEPKGKLYNVKDKRNYSYLFWDGCYEFPASHYNYKNGFYVKADNYVSFMLEKLEKIGLNETEINDFIVYWLPALSEYEESFIHFRINDDIGNSSKLDVSPKPDTMIRVFMEYKQYNEGEQKLPEQTLPTIARKKFTLVEWGGGEIETNMIVR